MPHQHVSERRVGVPWVLCTETSAVMWQIVTGDPVPADWDEACALRKAEAAGRSCSKGGTSMALLRQGIQRRWNRVPNMPARSFVALWDQLQPGHAAVVFGSMGGFPNGHHYRRWDPPFDGKHAVMVERRDDLDHVWWDDPLAPVGDYQGEWMDRADLARFVNAWNGALHLVAPMIGGDVADIPAGDPYPVGTKVAIRKGADIYSAPSLKVGNTSEPLLIPAYWATGTGYVVIPYRGLVRLVASKDATVHIAPAPVPVPPHPVPGPGPTYDDGRRDMYDLIVTNLPPRP